MRWLYKRSRVSSIISTFFFVKDSISNNVCSNGELQTKMPILLLELNNTAFYEHYLLKHNSQALLFSQDLFLFFTCLAIRN